MTSVENVRRVLGVVLMSILMVAVAFAQAKTSSDKAPSYELKDLSVDYGVKQGNQNGLLVKVVISATNANGVESFLRVTLLDEDEEPLEDTDGRFEVDGFVGTQSKIKPTRSPMDVTVNFFIPYDDIEVIGSGEQLLMLDVDVVDGVGDYYQHLGFHEFVFTVGKPSSQEDGVVQSDITGVISDVVIKHDVTQPGTKLKGMTLKFTVDQVKGLKGVGAVIAVRFLEGVDAEDYVQSALQKYADLNGDLIVSYPIKPAYDPAKFSEIELFVPYSAFPFKKGIHKIEVDFDILANEPDERFAHLGYKSTEIKIQ